MHTLRHVVVGTDFSPAAEQALELAITLALGAAARLTVVHVCQLGVDDDDERVLAQCDKALSRVVAEHRLEDLELTGVLRSGSPWQKLDNVATELGASVIVIGRHGAGRGPNVAIGSVAEQLVRTASRPVLTVACDFYRLTNEARDPNQLPRKNG
jgi:universal stress protein E